MGGGSAELRAVKAQIDGMIADIYARIEELEQSRPIKSASVGGSASKGGGASKRTSTRTSTRKKASK